MCVCVCPSPVPPYHNLIRSLGTVTKVKAEYLLISWDTVQVKLTESLPPVTVTVVEVVLAVDQNFFPLLQ